jgi:hypothetical protein
MINSETEKFRKKLRKFSISIFLRNMYLYKFWIRNFNYLFTLSFKISNPYLESLQPKKVSVFCTFSPSFNFVLTFEMQFRKLFFFRIVMKVALF